MLNEQHNYAFLQLISNQCQLMFDNCFQHCQLNNFQLRKNGALSKLFDDIISVDLSIYRENIRPTHHARMHAGLRYDD